MSGGPFSDLGKQYVNPMTAGEIVQVRVNPATYHAVGGTRGRPGFVMSRGELMEFNHCPSRWLAGFDSGESKATQWGDLMDCLILDPKRFDLEFAVQPEKYTHPKDGVKDWNNNATACKEWNAEHENQSIISARDWATGKTAREAIYNSQHAVALLKDAETQVWVSAEYHDTDTGLIVPVKCLIDIAPPALSADYGECLADFKTARSCDPFAWGRAVFDCGYHVQAAFYLDCYNSATEQRRNTFLHLCQENVPPFQVARRMLSGDYIDIGREKYLAALRRYCRCFTAGVWPDYDTEAELQINGWQIVQPEAWMVLK